MKKKYVEINTTTMHSSNLANQCQGRSLDVNETKLAAALMSIFEKGIHNVNPFVPGSSPGQGAN